MAYLPASVRYNNPGAQWPGPVASKWGSTQFATLNDGQGNRIAIFDDPVRGAAAHIDLLRSNYSGMSLSDAIRKWSGGNSVDAYVKNVSAATGLSPDTRLTPELLNSPQGLSLVKAMASHEKGPQGQSLSDDQWRSAMSMVFEGAPPSSYLASAQPQSGGNFEGDLAALKARYGGGPTDDRIASFLTTQQRPRTALAAASPAPMVQMVDWTKQQPSMLRSFLA